MIENANVYVDEAIIKHNHHLLRDMLNENSQVMAVIKANGYGAGLVESAQLCERIGIESLAVLNIEQGVAIRKAGVKLPIILLGACLESNFQYLIDYDLTQALISHEYAEKMAQFTKETKQKVKVHLKIDTGLNRLGFKNTSEILNVYEMPGIEITGIYSHFVSAQSQDKEDIEFSYQQVDKFKAVLKMLDDKGLDYGQTHMQNSPSILNFGDLGFDTVRCGMILYGLFHPSQKEEAYQLGFRNAISMKARVALVKSIKPGDTVGYGRTFKANKPMRIATISSGYCDGVMRSLSQNHGYVIYQDQKLPILGDIAMSQFMVDVKDLAIKEEDEVWIFGHPQQTIYDYIAYTGQTINELVSHLRLDMGRIYINQDKKA